MVKVILLQNIKGFGRMGDIKNVADGYAKNYLFPNKIAKLATSSNTKEAEVLKNKAEAMVEVEKKNAAGVAEKLPNITFEISRKASTTGTFFDGIEKADIVNIIKETAHVDLDEDMIILEDHIKKVGDYNIKIRLFEGIECEIKLIAKAE